MRALPPDIVAMEARPIKFGLLFLKFLFIATCPDTRQRSNSAFSDPCTAGSLRIGLFRQPKPEIWNWDSLLRSRLFVGTVALD